ncbi:MAG: hypothetical protein MJZ68_09550, partial [archaeon]|nr:hypothetical protein [archaeon]
MKPPKEHYILDPGDDGSFIEELEWYFEYNVPVDRISKKNFSRITAAINKREGHTEFRTDGSLIDVEFCQDSGKFEIRTNRAIMFADRLEFKKDYF